MGNKTSRKQPSNELMSNKKNADGHNIKDNNSESAVRNLPKKSSLNNIRSKVKNIFSHKDKTAKDNTPIHSPTSDNFVDVSPDEKIRSKIQCVMGPRS